MFFIRVAFDCVCVQTDLGVFLSVNCIKMFSDHGPGLINSSYAGSLSTFFSVICRVFQNYILIIY